MPAADGGPGWWRQASGPRPWLVEFNRCSNVTVNDVTLTNAPASNLVFRNTTHGTVSELTVTVTPDPRIPNTDGIDVIGSTRARADLPEHRQRRRPSVALTSGLPDVPTHDVQIVNSKFSNGDGIVIGGDAANGVYNVLANNITGTNLRHGVVISCRTAVAGNHDIWAQNMSARPGVAQPLLISDGSATANIPDITVKNLRATGATQPSVISGPAEACIRDVVLAEREHRR